MPDAANRPVTTEDILRTADQLSRQGDAADAARSAASRLERELSIANQQAHDSIVECARLLAALQEIVDSRESFGDDRLYANHAERVACNALNSGAKP